MILATKIFVSDDVRCRCEGVAMLKATSQIRRMAVAPGVETHLNHLSISAIK